MRIAIHASNLGLACQDRAYVEYRMFSAISRFGLEHAHLRIDLDENDRAHAAALYRCVVLLKWAAEERIRVRARAERLYRAVDAAAQRLADRVHRRLIDKGAVGGDVTGPGQAPARGARGR
jgi:ribosome-associated translation inhibitor RaiA